MIARIFIPVVVCILLPQLWLDLHYHRHWPKGRRALTWFVSLALIGYTAYLGWEPDFIPANPLLLDIWFVLMAVLGVPPFVYAACSWVGWFIMKRLHGRHNWGKPLGMLLSVVAVFCFVYGFTRGVRNMEVKHLTLYVPDLPKQFEGYRILQFSDIHLGSYYGWRDDLPQRDVDSINAQQADMICFTGDLQNVRPADIEPYVSLLRQLKAKDGVYSVLGNHDYSYYFNGTDTEKAINEKKLQRLEWQMGWRLLDNENVKIYRGSDSIFVVGTGNYEKPEHSDVAKSLRGIKSGSFVLMLQHNPKQWEETLPTAINKRQGLGFPQGLHAGDGKLLSPQLTLSGHTHAGQISVLGLRPTLFSAHDYGLYEKEGCLLYTTAGLGGVVPLRIGATPEIVVFTLRRK